MLNRYPADRRADQPTHDCMARESALTLGAFEQKQAL